MSNQDLAYIIIAYAYQKFRKRFELRGMQSRRLWPDHAIPWAVCMEAEGSSGSRNIFARLKAVANDSGSIVKARFANRDYRLDLPV